MNISEKNLYDFNVFLMNEEKAETTIEKYMHDIRVFAEWLNGKNVDKMEVLRYKEHIKQRYAPASVKSMLSSINSFFDFIGWNNLKVKMLKIQRQIFLSDEKMLTKSEYKRLLDAACKVKELRLYYIMQTICSSGIRVSELKSVTVEAVKKGKIIIGCKGKIREALLPKDLCKKLLKYARKNAITTGNIFVTKSGKPLDRSAIWKMMKRICSIAGVSAKKVFPHNLRHLFARTYYAMQKDIVRLADILGHSSVNTTRIYTMEPCENQRTRIEKLGLLQI